MANAIINSASSGDVTVQAAPSSGFLRVHGYVFMGAGNDTVYFAASADSVPLTGPYVLSAQAGVVAPVSDESWFDLPIGAALIVNKAAAVQLSGHVHYQVRK